MVSELSATILFVKFTVNVIVTNFNFKKNPSNNRVHDLLIYEDIMWYQQQWVTIAPLRHVLG